jgi:RNA polymerase sigma factor (sigma-70 family)
MTSPAPGPLLRHIRHLIGADAAAGLSDAQLLDRFLARRDEAAVEALVRRYGALVLSACRRVLHNAHAAEDAFQATFLVLLRKARSLDRRKPLGNWLYTVAHRLALRARANEARRRACEARAAGSRAEAVEPAGAAEALVALEEELHRLPEEHRTPLVLCYLEGKTNDQAAQEIGCPRGSMSWRLARARDMLRDRLARRGLPYPAAGVAALLSGTTASAAVPPALLHATVGAAVWFAGERVAAPAAVSAGAVALAKGALRTMITSQLKIAAGLLLAVGLLGAGATMLVSAADPQAPPARAADKAEPARAADANEARDNLPDGAVARLGTGRLRHGDGVFFAAYTPDGKALLTASKDQTIRLWDLATGKELRRFERGEAKGDALEDLLGPGLGKPVGGLPKMGMAAGLLNEAGRRYHVALSPDGKVVAATQGRTVTLWDADTGKRLHELAAVQPGISSLAFAADSKSLLTAGSDQSALVWDVATGKNTRQLGRKPGAGVIAFAPGLATTVSPDWKYLAWQHIDIAGQGFSLKVLNLDTGKELPEIKAPTGGAQSLTCSPEGKALLWAGPTGEVVLWDVGAGKERLRLPAARPDGAVTALAFSPDGKAFAVSRGERIVEVWDAATGKQLARAGEAAPGMARGVVVVVAGIDRGPGSALAFSPDGRTVVASLGSTTVRRFDAASGKEVAGPGGGHQAAVSLLGVCGDGEAVITYGRGDPARCWDLTTGREVRQLALPPGAACAAFSADGRRVAAAVGNSVAVYDAAGQELRKFDAGSSGIAALAFSPDGKALAVRSALAPEVHVWDATAGKELAALAQGAVATRGDGVTVAEASGVLTDELAFSADGRRVIGAGAKRQLVCWDAAGGEALWEVSLGAGQAVERFALSADGHALATLNSDGTVTLYEAATGEPRGRLGEPDRKAGGPGMTINFGGMSMPVSDRRDAPASLAFAPDGRHLAWAKGAPVIRLWDVVAAKEVGQLKGHDGGVVSLVFTPDGTRLVSGSADTTALTWDVSRALRAAPGQALAAGALDGLWADLAGKDAAKAFEALRKLAGSPAQAAALVKERVRPAAPADARRVAAMIADLESDEFTVRQKAEAGLEALGDLAEPELRQALEGGPGLDLRQRVERLLRRLSGQAASADLLRDLRAVELLEMAGGADARRVLDELSRGAPGARLTREAKAAAGRLAKRP